MGVDSKSPGDAAKFKVPERRSPDQPKSPLPQRGYGR
jgi:hypothetical protein